MGTLSSVKNLGNVENALDDPLLFEIGSDIRKRINFLENILANRYSVVDSVLSVPHLVFQEAVKDYFTRIGEESRLQQIREAQFVFSSDTVDPIPSFLAPDFFKYLSESGEVGTTNFLDNFTSYFRIGICLRKNSQQALIGLLTFNIPTTEIDYSGYVPVTKSFKKSLGPSYNLSSPPKIESIDFAYLRLFAEKNKNGNLERVDGYEKLGIKFP